MGNEEESKDGLVAKLLVDNPFAKWMLQMSVEKEERGKRPFVETIRSILPFVQPTWAKFDLDKSNQINDVMLPN